MPELNADLDQAIAKACDDGLVVKWVVVAEVATGDGKQLEVFTPEGTMLWDVLGMLQFEAGYLAQAIHDE